MPSRLLREGILDSEAVNALTFPAEVFYRRLMSVVDDYGRYDGRPSVLRAKLYPLKVDKVRESDIERWVAECVTAGLVGTYTADGKPYLLFKKLGSPRAKESKFPAPDRGYDESPEPARICLQTQTDENGCTQAFTDAPGSGSGSGSGPKSDAGSVSDSSAADQPPTEPAPPPDAVLEFETIGTGPKRWHLTRRQLDGWSAAYPDLDVLAEARKASVWLAANGFKTAKGMPRFLVNWFNRATNGRRGSQTAPASAARSSPDTLNDYFDRRKAEEAAKGGAG